MSLPPISRLSASALTNRVDGGTKPGDPSAGGFNDLVTNALGTVNAQQANADELARQAAVGQLKDPHEYMIAATEASLSTELTVAVRNKAVEAFNDIMRMNL